MIALLLNMITFAFAEVKVTESQILGFWAPVGECSGKEITLYEKDNVVSFYEPKGPGNQTYIYKYSNNWWIIDGKMHLGAHPKSDDYFKRRVVMHSLTADKMVMTQIFPTGLKIDLTYERCKNF